MDYSQYIESLTQQKSALVRYASNKNETCYFPFPIIDTEDAELFVSVGTINKKQLITYHLRRYASSNSKQAVSSSWRLLYGESKELILNEVVPPVKSNRRKGYVTRAQGIIPLDALQELVDGKKITLFCGEEKTNYKITCEPSVFYLFLASCFGYEKIGDNGRVILEPGLKEEDKRGREKLRKDKETQQEKERLEREEKERRAKEKEIQRIEAQKRKEYERQQEFVKRCIISFLVQNHSIYIEYENHYIVRDPMSYDYVLNGVFQHVLQSLKDSEYSSTSFAGSFDEKKFVSVIKNLHSLSEPFHDDTGTFVQYSADFNHYCILKANCSETPLFTESYEKGMAREFIRSEAVPLKKFFGGKKYGLFVSPQYFEERKKKAWGVLESKGIVSSSSVECLESESDGNKHQGYSYYRLYLTNYKKICAIIDGKNRNYLKERKIKRWVIAILIIVFFIIVM